MRCQTAAPSISTVRKSSSTSRVKGDYGHRMLNRHQARVLRTQLRRVRRRRRECAEHSAICDRAGGWFDEDHHGGRSTAPVAVRRRDKRSLSSRCWQRRCRQPRSPLGGQGHRCGLRDLDAARRLEPNRGPRLVRPVLTRTTSKLYFRRAVYVCGGHELSDEKRSVRSWITNVIHQILLRFHQMNHGYGVAASVACWLW